jgi:tRNA nucleotidyltransferase (CCA-adding enzyme)
MDRYHSPGTTSSCAPPPPAEALARLRGLCARDPLKNLCRVLQDGKPHLVGGAVRDVLSGLEPSDFDLATSLRPDEAIRLLSQAGIKVVETGIKHGTLSAIIGPHQIEITTFRRPAARDQALFSDSIEEDLSGRDFCINAMAYSCQDQLLVDPFGGRKDLTDNLLRAVGSAEERLREDPLRIMRMLRFGPAQGRTVEAALETAAQKLAGSLKNVSPERIRTEFEHILLSPYPAAGLRSMLKHKVLALLFPELMPMVGFEQNKYHTQNVFEHTLAVIEAAPPELTLRLAALFHDAGKPESLLIGPDGERHFYEHERISERIAKSVMEQLRFSNQSIQSVALLVRQHMRPLECGPAGARRLLRDLGPHFESWRRLKMADVPPVISPQEFTACLNGFDKLIQNEQHRTLAARRFGLVVDGHELIQLGIKPGPGLGKILKQLEEAIIEDPTLNERETLLKLAAQIMHSQV